ncbi:MAG TPA: serine hydrolase domain-containing protein [Fimbriimonas sp.]|nr:serine hydrolase domain-containing protein [Fimbriimonas sp.]
MLSTFAFVAVTQLQVTPTQNGQIKVDPKNIKVKPFSHKEPAPGYLSEFKWETDIPVNGSLGDNKTYEKVTKGIRATMKANGIPGAQVAILDNDELVYSRAFGYSNLSTMAEFVTTMPTRCGSISKTACALAALRLVEQGKLSLDETIFSIFPALSNPGGPKTYKEGWQNVRVRDLMDQCSGIPAGATYLTSHKMADGLKKKMRLSKLDLLGYAITNIDLIKPRKKWAYNNLNFEILSLIIEHKTGRNFADALQTLVVQPLGIGSTQMFLSPTVQEPPAGRAREARYYQKQTQMLESIYEKGKLLPEAYGGLDGEVLSGAGHIAFTAEAIAKMVQALRDRPTTVLKSTLWSAITTRPEYVDSGLNKQFTESFYYSKGTWVTKNNETKENWFQHGAMLMHAAGNYYPYNNRYQVVVLANSNSKSGTLHDQFLSAAVNSNLPN